MKIGITHRLFFSILAATCLAILCMFLVMRWSIDRGFLQYLNTLDQGRLEQLAARLEATYAEHENWDFMRDNPRPWIIRMLNAPPGEEGVSERAKDVEDTPPPPPPPRGVHRPRFRVILLDARRVPLFGDPSNADEVSYKPLVHKGETVGYLGFLPPRHFLNPQQADFLSRQRLALALVAAGVVLIVAIFSLPLAKRLVSPIKAMASATHDIASGKYAVRVPDSSSDELGRLARDFNSMALTLEKNEKTRRQWVADISHELRTPLAVLRGEIEALLDGIRTVTPETVRSLHAEVMRLHRLVEDLYQLALSDLGALAYRKEDLDLVEMIGDAIESYGAEFVRKGITLSADLSAGSDITVFGDRERLHQLFANVLDNSLKYTDAGGQFAIRMRCHEDQATVDFEDSAPGVPDAELERLFERLYRVEGSRNKASGGAGLGLAICRNIVEAHAGTISAHRSPLGGLLIRVTLPVSRGSL